VAGIRAFPITPCGSTLPSSAPWKRAPSGAGRTGAWTLRFSLDAAFLLFQIGPVQDFIAQARKTQDLWSGSYLLSFLIAQGMLAIADQIGPDAIVYPLLRGIPLADWHWKAKDTLRDGDDLHVHPNELLIPSLPNRFLAVVPAACADELARLAAEKIRSRWNSIAEAVRAWLDQQLRAEYGDRFDGWDALWKQQVSVFPQIDYVVHKWRDTETVLKQAAAGEPPVHGGWPNHPLHHAELWAKDMIPPEHRDARCYKHRSWREGDRWRSELLDAQGNPLAPNARPLIDNPGFAWALHYAATDWRPGRETGTEGPRRAPLRRPTILRRPHYHQAPLGPGCSEQKG